MQYKYIKGATEIAIDLKSIKKVFISMLWSPK